MELLKNTNINFMAAKNVGFTISSICFVLSLFMIFSGLNLGIDFRGGTMIGLNFSEEVEKIAAHLIVREQEHKKIQIAENPKILKFMRERYLQKSCQNLLDVF